MTPPDVLIWNTPGNPDPADEPPELVGPEPDRLVGDVVEPAGEAAAPATPKPPTLSVEHLNRLMEWFGAVEDLSRPGYLDSRDYELARRIALGCGRRPPTPR